MTVEIHSPSDLTGVRRARDGRPYVRLPCPADLCRDGRVAGAREGSTRQCPACKGNGYIERLYYRCTSFVSALDDRTQLERWKLRTTLVGVGVDHGLLDDLAAADPDDQETLNSLADRAFVVGEGHARAQKGTDLHRLTEYVDLGEPLPRTLVDYATGQERPVTLQDRADMAAWRRVMDDHSILIERIECFVVLDDYQIGGTYDRLVSLPDSVLRCGCGGQVILDLKTGRIDYGAGRIAQQLAVYAHSRDYDPATGVRTEPDVCTHLGLVVHLPQGTGEATVHVADLEAGWAAVALSSRVREYRRMSPRMLWSLNCHADMMQ